MKNILTYLLFAAVMSFTGCGQSMSDQKVTGSASDSPVLHEHDYLIEKDTSVFYGELVYVPVYSEVYYGDQDRTIDLALTLSIHNTDLEHPITLNAVNYHNKGGKLIRNLLASPIVLKPLETRNFIIKEKDKEGGTGANFIVDWQTMELVSNPIIEALMITTQMNQGISFTTKGEVIKKYGLVE